MKRFAIFQLALFAAVWLIASCDRGPRDPLTPDQRFEGYRNRFIIELWRLEPVWASSVGYHDFDTILPIPGTDRLVKISEFCHTHLDSLAIFDPARLGPSQRTDLAMIKAHLNATLWEVTEFRAFEWNPSLFNVAGAIDPIMNSEHATIEGRLLAVNKRLRDVPAYYAGARSLIINPTREHTELAILQNRGALELLGKSFTDTLASCGLTDSLKKVITANADLARKAIDEHVVWLETQWLPKLNENARSPRIGSTLFRQKFAHDINSVLSADELFVLAIQEKDRLHAKMDSLTKMLWPKYMAKAPMPTDSILAIRKLIDTLSVHHAHPDSFLQSIETQIPELTRFVNEKELLTLDPSKPLKVREEPPYMAGVAAASISAPGPYDRNRETWYNVRPLSGMEPARAESFLREYNHYILQILNIHEAIPGHYAQLVYNNQSPSLIKSILGNGAMVEGWAVYTERMMLEAGYGNNSPELWLMYYKWNLRTVCNAILDHSIHVLGMTENQALDLLMNQAFQQEAEARGKFRRAMLTQVQLSTYFSGYMDIMALREEIRKTKGNTFNIKLFHQELLSHGSAPVRMVRTLMLPNENRN